MPKQCFVMEGISAAAFAGRLTPDSDVDRIYCRAHTEIIPPERAYALRLPHRWPARSMSSGQAQAPSVWRQRLEDGLQAAGCDSTMV